MVKANGNPTYCLSHNTYKYCQHRRRLCRRQLNNVIVAGGGVVKANGNPNLLPTSQHLQVLPTTGADCADANNQRVIMSGSH